MIELGELEKRHQDFEKRNIRVVAVSMEGQDDAKKNQADFPHLQFLADDSRGLTDAGGFVHRGANPKGGDADAPTTVLVDRHGEVRWLYRPPSAMSRLTPDEVLQAIDAHMAGT